MSLKGYIKKSKPALWLDLPSERLARQWQAEARSKARTPRLVKARKPIRRRAKGHASEDKAYREAARAFVRSEIDAGKVCPVVLKIDSLRNGRKYGHPISAQLKANHHIFGRQGRLLMWRPGWMAISTQGHRFVHSNIEQARQHGWYAPKGLWNNEAIVDWTPEQLAKKIKELTQ